jgi:N-acetylglucosamine-6-phosphate deacetylase
MKVPGFVDLQVNGYVGIDFSSKELTAEQVAQAARELVARGTAAFLPTIITNPAATFERNLPLIARVMDTDEFRARLLGFHIEGPFISPTPGAVGAHDADSVVEPDVAMLDMMIEASGGRIKILTIAPETPGAEELTRHAVAKGITVSLGHHLGLEGDLDRVAKAGAKALTHLGNGVPPMLARHPNPIWAGLADDRYTAGLITDGHHLPPSFIKTALRAKGVEKVFVVSDSVATAGMPPGRYGSTVLEESGKLHMPDRGVLAGSSANMLECMNHLASLGLLKLEELMAVCRTNPLRLIGIEESAVALEPMLEYDEGERRFRLA